MACWWSLPPARKVTTWVPSTNAIACRARVAADQTIRHETGAEYVVPCVILADRMPARRKGEPNTELLKRSIGAAGVVMGAQQNLMWILAVKSRSG
jgi:hypothetical protein